MDLLGMELTCLAGIYQFNGVLEGRRLIKSMPKGFTEQRAGRCMVLTLASMDLYE
jgi:hypothetical protein